MALSVALSGCLAGGSSCNQVGNGVQCSFGGAGSGEVSTTWSNGGTKANVHVQFGGAGSATITVRDGSGNVVFNRDLSGTGGQQTNDVTSTGAPGTWTLKITARNLAGGLQVRATSA